MAVTCLSMSFIIHTFAWHCSVAPRCPGPAPHHTRPHSRRAGTVSQTRFWRPVYAWTTHVGIGNDENVGSRNLNLHGCEQSGPSQELRLGLDHAKVAIEQFAWPQPSGTFSGSRSKWCPQDQRAADRSIADQEATMQQKVDISLWSHLPPEGLGHREHSAWQRICRFELWCFNIGADFCSSLRSSRLLAIEVGGPQEWGGHGWLEQRTGRSWGGTQPWWSWWSSCQGRCGWNIWSLGRNHGPICQRNVGVPLVGPRFGQASEVQPLLRPIGLWNGPMADAVVAGPHPRTGRSWHSLHHLWQCGLAHFDQDVPIGQAASDEPWATARASFLAKVEVSVLSGKCVGTVAIQETTDWRGVLAVRLMDPEFFLCRPTRINLGLEVFSLWCFECQTLVFRLDFQCFELFWFPRWILSSWSIQVWPEWACPSSEELLLGHSFAIAYHIFWVAFCGRFVNAWQWPSAWIFHRVRCDVGLRSSLSSQWFLVEMSNDSKISHGQDTSQYVWDRYYRYYSSFVLSAW